MDGEGSGGDRVIKENQKLLNRTHVLIDAMIIVCSFLIAFYLRFFTSLLPEGVINLSLWDSLIAVLVVVPVYLSIYQLSELYSVRRTRTVFDEFRKIVSANTIGILILVLFLFVFKLIDFSRYVLIMFYFINIGLASLVRLSLRIALRRFRKSGYNLKHCLLIGASDTGAEFLKRVYQHPEWGYNVVGVLDDYMKEGTTFAGKQVIGKIKDMEEILAKKNLDIVIIAITSKDYEKLGKIMNSCEKDGVKTNIIPYYYKYVPARPYVDDLDGMPVIDTRYVPLDNVVRKMVKRTMDIAVSLLAIAITAPVMLICAFMIRCTSPGPVIYQQTRVGIKGTLFVMYKFRSMEHDDPQSRGMACTNKNTSQEAVIQRVAIDDDSWTVPNDPRRTKWGAFIRKTSIDELPQFFNVLKGDMSVVGPRPERPLFVEKFKENIPKYMIKHQVRPGITGWAQVNGWRGDTSIKKRIEHDLYYIENWTFAFDVKIIILTILKGMINRNAY